MSMSEGRDTVAQYCFESDWLFDVIDETTLTAHVRVGEDELRCSFKTPHRSFVMLSRFPFDIPDATRGLVLEMVAREICQPDVSSPYLDLDTGEIGIKTAIPVEDGYLSLALIDQVVGCNLKAAERWIPALAKLCDRDISSDSRVSGARFLTLSPHS
jgi:hypothetical protein